MFFRQLAVHTYPHPRHLVLEDAKNLNSLL